MNHRGASIVRIAVGTFSQESNTFSPVPTDMPTFQRYGYFVGDEFEVRGQGTRSAMSSFVEVADERGGVEILPLARARAGANGRVTKEAFDEVTGAFVDQLRSIRAQGEVDAVYLDLHGAMAA
ncbi:MAG: M81 family metallopeptidase, partial [Nitriliruptoraceae bacterium]